MKVKDWSTASILARCSVLVDLGRKNRCYSVYNLKIELPNPKSQKNMTEEEEDGKGKRKLQTLCFTLQKLEEICAR